jgi:hypothetical protein
MKCAIHQPNFFPWLGYFDKIKSCDSFVILDDAQIQKTGGTYTNRVALNVGGVSKNYTAPIVKSSLQINEIEFLANNWRDKLIKTLQANYAKSKNFKLYKDEIFEMISNKENNLALYNENVIFKICDLLKIDTTHIVKSSDMNITTTSTQRLIDICKDVKCDTYISGGGGDNYQEQELYDKHNIKLAYQEYKHPVYTQKSDDFIAGLSAIDYIFEGLENEY